MVHKIHIVGYRLIHFKSAKFLTAINWLIINIPSLYTYINYSFMCLMSRLSSKDELLHERGVSERRSVCQQVEHLQLRLPHRLRRKELWTRWEDLSTTVFIYICIHMQVCLQPHVPASTCSSVSFAAGTSVCLPTVSARCVCLSMTSRKLCVFWRSNGIRSSSPDSLWLMRPPQWSFTVKPRLTTVKIASGLS